jgi:hypothetical protein
MKAKFLTIFLASAAAIATAYAPITQAHLPQSGGNQAPAGAPASGQGGSEGSRRGGEGRGRGTFGKISALQADSIEITRPDGTSLSVKLTSSTEFRKDRQPAKLKDFKVGDTVMVRTEQSAGNSSSATATMVAAIPAGGFGGRGEGRGEGQGRQVMMQGTMGKDYIVGEVKSIDAPKLTILREDHVTQTLELNEETSLRRGRESITMADIQPGDHVFARGALAGDVFVPKGVNVISPEQWKRMQEMTNEGGERRGGTPQSAPAPTTSAPPQNPPEQRN